MATIAGYLSWPWGFGNSKDIRWSGASGCITPCSLRRLIKLHIISSKLNISQIINYYTIIEWFRSIHWIIFCENLQYQPSGRRPWGWYCKFEQNIIQCILRNHSIIVLSHRVFKERLERESKEWKDPSGDSGFELLWLGDNKLRSSNIMLSF